MTTLEMTEREIRDMVITMLTKEYNYPINNIEIDVSKSLGNARFTADIVVYSDDKPHILLEVKNTKFNLNRGRTQLEKITQAIKPNFTVITNGIDYRFYQVQKDNFSTSLIKIPDIPRYAETLEDITSINQNELIALSSNRYLTMMWRHFDILRGEAYPMFDLFKYLLLLYATKYRDEINDEYQFSAEANPEKTKNKILGLVNKLLRSNEYLENVQIPFKSESIQHITLDMQKASLSKSSEEFRKIIPTIIQKFGKHLEFYTTPEIIANLIVDIVNPTSNNRFLDPACGLGGFLIKVGQKGTEIEGIEISRETSHLGNLILLLSGIEGKIHWANSLRINEEYVGKFDYVAVSPPFGQVITEEMWDYQLFNQNTKTFSEELFLEATLRYLKPNGLGAILVPNGFLFHTKYSNARQYLLKNSILKGIFKINPDVYSGWFRLTSSLIIFEKNQKGTSEEDFVFFSHLTSQNYEEIVNKYHRFSDGDSIETSEKILVSKIKSDENLDIEYIKGSRFIESLDSFEFIDLRRLVEIISGTSLNRIGEKNEQGDYIYIRVSNIGDGSVEVSQADIISVSDENSKYIAKQNDILLSRAGTVGKVAIIKNERNMVIGSNVVILRVKDKRITPEFLLGFLISNLGQRQLEMYTTGTTINHINTANLGKLRIPLLDNDAQNIVVSLLNNFVSLKKEEEELILRMRMKRENVLSQLDSAFEDVR